MTFRPVLLVRRLSLAVSVLVLWSLFTTAVAEAASRTPTRLVSPALAFRLTGYENLSSFSNLQDFRYAVVFKLNRDPLTVERADDDKDAPEGTQAPIPGATTRGNYYLRGYDFRVGRFYGSKQTTKRNRNCFVGFVSNDVPEYLREFGRVRLGRRVRFTSHPTRYESDGSVGFDRLQTVRPKLRQADVRLNDRPTRRLLRRIGCAPKRS